MSPDTLHPDTKLPAPDAPLAVPPPEPRKSKNLGLWDYVKDKAMVLIVAKVTFWGGYLATRFAPEQIIPQSLRAMRKGPPSMFTGKPTNPLANYVGFATGAVGALYEGWKTWRKDKTKELGVKDIHQDLYNELDPKILQAEVEQNQRIQDGLLKLHGIEPRGSFTDAAGREAAAAAQAQSAR